MSARQSGKDEPGARRLASAIAVAAFCASLAMRSRILETQDVYYHIIVGRWTLAHAAIPDRGLFSGSLPDAPWLAHEWLASVFTAVAYDLTGWNGLVAAATLALAGAVGVVAYEVGRTAGPVQALACALLTWGLSLNHLRARPHMATLLFFAIWLAAHVRARAEERTPSLLLLPLLALWANLHGGFLAGPAFTALFAAEAMFDARSLREAARRGLSWGLFLAATCAAAAITPHGLAGLGFPLRLAAMSTALAGIQEWRPSSLANNPSLIFWLLIVLFASLQFELRARTTRLAMTLALIYAAFAHVRHTDLLAVGAPLLLQDSLADLRLPKFAAGTRPWDGLSRWRSGPGVALVGLAAVAISLATLARTNERDADAVTPRAAVDWALAQPLQGPVMNAYNFGGYLIFRGVAPYIDGRIELYGEAFVAHYDAVEGFLPLLDAYGARWTIFEPNNPRVALLDLSPAWRRAYSGADAVIHVRSP